MLRVVSTFSWSGISLGRVAGFNLEQRNIVVRRIEEEKGKSACVWMGVASTDNPIVIGQRLKCCFKDGGWRIGSL